MSKVKKLEIIVTLNVMQIFLAIVLIACVIFDTSITDGVGIAQLFMVAGGICLLTGSLLLHEKIINDYRNAIKEELEEEAE